MTNKICTECGKLTDQLIAVEYEGKVIARVCSDHITKMYKTSIDLDNRTVTMVEQ